MPQTDLAIYRCPKCRGDLVWTDAVARCNRCARDYPVDGVPDFRSEVTSAGVTDEVMTSCAHESEEEGTAWRAHNYYAEELARIGLLTSLRLLDDGCGNGRLVDELSSMGVEAWGVDPGHRNEQWDRRDSGHRLSKGDGLALPFADGTFDAVVSSCVLPHIGEFMPDRAQQRDEYVAEALRVLRPGGVLFLSHPNGAFPVDFWHRGIHSIRPHWPYEAWMPSLPAVRRHLRRTGVETDIELIPPDRFVSWLRVRGDRLGRLLTPVAKANMWVLRRLPFLLGSPVNPMLVMRISRRD